MFSTLEHVYSVALNAVPLLAYLALMFANDLKYFQRTHGCDKKTCNDYCHRKDKPLADPKPQHDDCHRQDPENKNSLQYSLNGYNGVVS